MKLTTWSSHTSHEWPNGDISRYSYGSLRSAMRCTNARLSRTNRSCEPHARNITGSDSGAISMIRVAGSRSRRSGVFGGPNRCCVREVMSMFGSCREIPYGALIAPIDPNSW